MAAFSVPAAVFAAPASAATSASLTHSAAPSRIPAGAHVTRSAGRACGRKWRVRGCGGPEGSADRAAQLPRLDAVLAAADKDGFAADEGFGDLGATTLKHAADGLPRHAHRCSRLFVTEALEIDEADGLELVDGQR
jgi:hypothetical protein